MERIIPSETYRFIEAKLHGYEKINRKIEEWELSVRHPENKQTISGAGYISDPTANQAIKLANPPGHIRKFMKWRVLIEQTQIFCRKRQKKSIFDIWYGQGWQTATQAYTRNGISKLTFKKNRDSAVSFLLFRAIDAGLCCLYNEKDKNSAI